MSFDALPLPVLGLLLGIQHATEPDHVVAVTTLVAREHSLRRAVGLGAAWGLGHTLTVVLLGTLIVAFRPVVPTHLGLGLEFLVALMLIGLGLRNIVFLPSRTQPPRVVQDASEEPRSPNHDVGHDHDHPHPHDTHGDHHHVEGQDDHAHGAGHTHGMASLHGHDHGSHGEPPRTWPGAVAVGGLHGLAGSTAVALIVLMTVRQAHVAMAYLAVFGLGTIVGMALLTLLVGFPMLLAARRSGVAHRWISWSTGAAGVALGCRLVWRIGLIDGLFTSHPHWTPQ